MTIHAVLLAAGASSRYGTAPPKQQELLPRVLAALRASSVDDVVVVTGAHRLEALGDEVEAAVVVLGDGPDLDPRAIERVIAAWRETGAQRVAATYGGVRLHPVLLARAAWARIPDDGARSLPARLVACDDLAPPGDVDVRA